jgi:hypothetical protein
MYKAFTDQVDTPHSTIANAGSDHDALEGRQAAKGENHRERRKGRRR